MRIKMLISPFVLFLILGGLIVLAPIYAAATCCGCGMCWMKNYTYPPCICNGTPPCAACLTDDSDRLQLNAFLDKAMADNSSIPGIPAPTVMTTDVTEGVKDLMSGGKCFHEKVAYSLLGNTRDELKFVPVRFNENELLAFKMEADQEKSGANGELSR